MKCRILCVLVLFCVFLSWNNSKLFSLISAVRSVSFEPSSLSLKLLYCSCPIDSTIRTDTAAAADSHNLVSNVTRSSMSYKVFTVLSNTFYSCFGLLMCMINWYGWKTPIASSYCPVSLLKLYLDSIWENFQVSDMDGKPSGIVLVVESKEQRHKLPKVVTMSLFPMCPDEHEYDFLVLVYEEPQFECWSLLRSYHGQSSMIISVPLSS